MRTKRLALGAVTGLLLVGIGAGLYALPQNTSPDPHPFMGRGMGPRGPMGRGGPMGPGGGPLGFLPILGVSWG
jgi:hypothetical protein